MYGVPGVFGEKGIYVGSVVLSFRKCFPRNFFDGWEYPVNVLLAFAVQLNPECPALPLLLLPLLPALLTVPLLFFLLSGVSGLDSGRVGVFGLPFRLQGPSIGLAGIGGSGS